MSKGFLPLIAERVLGRPLLIQPALADTLYAVLEGRIGGTELAEGASLPSASRFVGDLYRNGGPALTRATGDTAVITIAGSLVNRGAWLDTECGLVSYEGIGAQVREVAADPEIRNVVLDIDSGGGEAGGMFALAEQIRGLRQAKTVVAVVNDVAASAAYGIASAADRIVVSETSVVGSIGVVMLHLDRSGEMAAQGIKPTLIYSGAKKVDGNPFGPLPDNVRAELERHCAAFYDRFLATVSAGRGRRLSAAAARATEAGTFIGAAAVKAGLADDVGSLDGVLVALAARNAKSSPKAKKGSTTMFHNETDPAVIAQACSDERARMRAILALPEAQSRRTLATNLAVNSDMTVEAVKATLAEQPIEAQPGAQPAPGAAALARDSKEIGAEHSLPITADSAKAGWKNTIARINAGRGNVVQVRG